MMKICSLFVHIDSEQATFWCIFLDDLVRISRQDLEFWGKLAKQVADEAGS